jgi:hypothetical protein
MTIESLQSPNDNSSVTPSGAAPPPKTTRNVLLSALLILFLTSLVAGYFTAQAMSPRWSSSIVLRDYVIQHAELRCVNRRVVSETEAIYTPHLSFTCEATDYLGFEDGTVTTKPSNAQLGFFERRRGITLDQTLTLLVSGGTASLTVPKSVIPIRNVLEHAAPLEKVKVVAAGVLLVGSGFVVGYWLGLEAAPDCGEFQKQQITIPAFWSGVQQAVLRRFPPLLRHGKHGQHPKFELPAGSDQNLVRDYLTSERCR